MKKFMSYRGNVIWYESFENGELYFSVAAGDGTDVHFRMYVDAMDYIDSLLKEGVE